MYNLVVHFTPTNVYWYENGTVISSFYYGFFSFDEIIEQLFDCFPPSNSL